MITANFIHRIFRIRCEDSFGTAFTIDVDGRQYLVTARHVVQAFPFTSGLQIFGKGEWNTTEMRLVGHGNGEIDVSVFASTKPLTPASLPIVASSDGLTYGQEVFFLGFPYGILGNVVLTEHAYHLPMVKRATMSLFAGEMYLLDGHNNPGFSGGPVLFGQPGKSPTNIGAVVSGYKSVREPVYQGSNKTNLSYGYNTGIIVSYKIEAALELIRTNPIGPRL